MIIHVMIGFKESVGIAIAAFLTTEECKDWFVENAVNYDDVEGITVNLPSIESVSTEKLTGDSICNSALAYVNQMLSL